ncbi:MAG: ABC transporter permease [Opitutaceae bacterium]|nr:ABC transporter permease [Opitutaceae bacterium]
MPESLETAPARATATAAEGGLDVAVGGVWQVTEPRPVWARVLGGARPARVRLRAEGLATWDTSLLLFLFEVREWCRAAGAECDAAPLPEKIRVLLDQFGTAHDARPPADRMGSFIAGVGHVTVETWGRARTASTFLGESVLGVARLFRRPAAFRWGDCLGEMQQCGAMALPIVSLISFLVGLIMAYQAAVQLRQFGADIYVADLVGLSVVREMGPMMAAVILAGRTGAAFAATLANMKASEEVDALETLGIPPVDFLVLPRIVALTLMMPLLALYADCVGILGGMAVGAGVLEIPPAAYWIETQSIVDLSDVNTGLLKSVAFGLLIGIASCWRGLQAERSAAGVGRAATSAVVTSILLVIVADALFAVVFNILGW